MTKYHFMDGKWIKPTKTGKKAPASTGPSFATRLAPIVASVSATATLEILDALKDIQTQLKAITNYLDKIKDQMFTNTELKLVGKDFDNVKKDFRYVGNCLWYLNKELSENVDRTQAEARVS